MSAALPRDRVEEMLRDKLQAEVLESGRDHRFYVLRANGKVISRTKVSTGTKYKTLGDDLVSAMAKQCKVTSKQFLELVNCTMSRDQWVSHLLTQGFLN